MESSNQALARARPKANNRPTPNDPIRSVIVKGVEYWMVTLPKHGGGRNRRYFRSMGEAKTYLLENASDDTLPYWAIGGFTGLRAAELERLNWGEVHFDSDLVEVKAANSKTASRRFVPIRPALKEWLAPYEGRKGTVAPKALRKRLERDRKLANIEHWPSNGLRHSFASYHAAEFRDAGMLALELGHPAAEARFAPHAV